MRDTPLGCGKYVKSQAGTKCTINLHLIEARGVTARVAD
jgi:hypothetical protein